MKNRDYKNFSQGNYYHLFNRGNNKQDIFLDNDDYKFFLFRLKENLFPPADPKSPEDGPPGAKGREDMVRESHTPYIRKTLPAKSFDLLCYCLMPNHFHLLIKQNSDVSISKLVTKVCTGYSMYFNKKYGKVGNLFQHKVKAILVSSDPQLMWLTSYIHNNPLTAGLIDKLEHYPWSSYPDYVGIRHGTLPNTNIVLGMFLEKDSYKDFVKNSSDLIKAKKNLEKLLLDFP